MVVKLTIEAENFTEEEADIIEKAKVKSGLSWHNAIIEAFKLLLEKSGGKI